jgi:hypothetical protein
MPGSPTTRARRQRETAMQLDAEATMESLCEEIARGAGANAWMKAHDVSYSRMVQWIEADTQRAAVFDAAVRARAANAAGAVEAIGRRLLNPDAATDNDWVPRRTRTVIEHDAAGNVTGQREELVELDARAARVAAAAFQWTAEKGDRTRFGKHTEHHHTHAVQFEHLAALRAMMTRSPSQRAPMIPIGPVSEHVRALPAPIDAEFRPILSNIQRLTIDEVRARIRVRRTLPSTQ